MTQSTYSTNVDGRIEKIISRTDCKKHHALLNEPCWELRSPTGEVSIRFAVCGDRSRKIFDGQVGSAPSRAAYQKPRNNR